MEEEYDKLWQSSKFYRISQENDENTYIRARGLLKCREEMLEYHYVSTETLFANRQTKLSQLQLLRSISSGIT